MSTYTSSLNALVAGPGIGNDAMIRATVAKEGVHCTVLANGKECLAEAGKKTPDLILIELAGSGVDCVEAIRFLRAKEDLSETPILVLGPQQGPRASALSAGATDFLTLPCDDTELTSRIRSIVGLARLLRKLEEAHSRLDAATMTDQETGVLDRRYLDKRLPAEVKAARRHDLPISIISVRLDPPFDQIGFDFFPYLRAAAEAIVNLVRDEDLVARYADDEFLVVLPHTDSYGSLILAERVREIMTDLPAPPPPISASVGVASCQKEDDYARLPLLERARSAMQQARTAGGNRVVKQD